MRQAYVNWGSKQYSEKGPQDAEDLHSGFSRGGGGGTGFFELLGCDCIIISIKIIRGFLSMHEGVEPLVCMKGWSLAPVCMKGWSLRYV